MYLPSRLPANRGPFFLEKPVNELIPITTASISGTEVNAVDARILHSFLGVKSNFRDWIRNRIEDFGFVENQDFVGFAKNLAKPNGGRPTAEYVLSLNMAKELSMVERTEKGKQARLYFIDCERRAKEAAATPKIPQTFSEALRLAADLEDQKNALAAQIKEDAPKIEFAERISHGKDSMTFREAAKVLGIGEHRLLDFLRVKQWIFARGTQPYADKVKSGYLSFRYHPITHKDGTVDECPYSRILPRSLYALYRLLLKEGMIERN